MIFKKILYVVLCLSLVLITFGSCIETDGGKVNDPEVQTKAYYEYFDTKSVIYSYKGDSAAEFDSNHKAVAEILSEYHKLFDIYYEYSGVNNLRTVNKRAGIEPVKVDERIIDFLLYAKEIYTLTNVKTNVAMGSVLKLWHDCREASEDGDPVAIPDEAALKLAGNHCDINNVIINREEGTVYLADPEMSLDVGALGKGYATEKAADMLIARGVSSYVLNIGGNIRAIGAKVSGEGWVTGITNPDKDSTDPFVLKTVIKGTSLVTSGDYERYFVSNGVKYHHIIDPVTLMPASYFSSVSVFTEDSGLADALSTALFCMSYEDGLKLVSDIGGVDVIWVDTEYNVRMTDGVTVKD